MDKFKVNTPEGTRDRLFAECKSRRKAQSAMTSLFKRRGYSEVVTPEVEYYDLFLRSNDPLPQESLMKIVDRSGKILVMRPDCTMPIARVVATKLKNAQFPQRLYYNQTIFRSDELNVGSDSEIAQCGIELFGAGGVRGDAEAVAMAVDTLRTAGAENFHIELGHSALFKALAPGLEAGEESLERMRLHIESKNVAALSRELEPFGDSLTAAALRRLPFMFGGAEVLREAGALPGFAGAREQIEYLRELYEELDMAGRGDWLRFDLGLVNRLEYYSGLVFRGYVEGAGSVVLAGGRYDGLTGLFGREMPATGFAVYVDALADCLPQTELPQLEAVVHCQRGFLSRAFEIIDQLPAGTAELSPFETADGSRELAHRKGAKRLLSVTAAGETEELL